MRWTQPDSVINLGATPEANRSLYAAGDPVNMTDPSGRSLWSDAVDLVGAALTIHGVAEEVTACVEVGEYAAIEGGPEGAIAGCVTGMTVMGARAALEDLVYEKLREELED
jgi:hypothetical protein